MNRINDMLATKTNKKEIKSLIKGIYIGYFDNIVLFHSTEME